MEEYKYLVSIRCMTYNQSPYIKEALDGFVMQRTHFPFLAVIVDDASTDCEQDIIKAYVGENFYLSVDNGYKAWETDDAKWVLASHKENENCNFLVVFLKTNLYGNPKKYELIREWCDTKYIALCEGDDYWTDPLKLQKQVDYMEVHEDCVMCSHAVFWETKGEMNRWGCQYEYQCNLTTDEVIREGGLYIATCSLLFRKELDEDRPEWRKLSRVGDFPLQILGTLRGDLHFFPELMGVYRFQRPGSFTDFHNTVHLDYARNQIESLELLDAETGHAYLKAINTHLYMWYHPLYLAKEIKTVKYLFVGINSYGKFPKVVKDIFNRKFHLLYIVYSKLRSI